MRWKGKALLAFFLVGILVPRIADFEDGEEVTVFEETIVSKWGIWGNSFNLRLSFIGDLGIILNDFFFSLDED